jgi:hypothetical protein
MIPNAKMITVSFTVQRLIHIELALPDEWRDDGQLTLDLVFDPSNSDCMTCLGADVGMALADYLSHSGASKGIYRLGEHEKAPIYEYGRRGELTLVPVDSDFFAPENTPSLVDVLAKRVVERLHEESNRKRVDGLKR